MKSLKVVNCKQCGKELGIIVYDSGSEYNITCVDCVLKAMAEKKEGGKK